MAGIKYEEMPRPTRPFRPDRDTRREDGKITFETLSGSLKEDAARSGLIMKAIEQLPVDLRDGAIDLANRLNDGVETHTPSATLASHLFMRNVRIRVIGNLWSLIEREALAPVSTVTLRPTGMWVPENELMNINPRTFMRRLQQDLYRAGVTKTQGYLLAGLHSEFDVNRLGYDFHYHLVVGSQMAEAIEALRDLRRFKAGRIQDHERGLPESPRVRRSEQPLTDEPAPLTYVLQSSHPHRPTVVEYDGTRTRSKNRYRIPEPFHTQWLLWMDRWSVSHLLFSVGMIPTTTGFQLNP